MHHRHDDPLMKDTMELSQVWMSHSDSVLELPEQFEVMASTDTIPYAAFRKSTGKFPLYGVQFHPERLYENHAIYRKLFSGFVRACGK